MLGWIQNALVVIVDILFIVIHATVADIDGILVEDFSKIVVIRKLFVYQCEESCPILVLTFLLNGGLIQRMLFQMSVSPFGSRGWLVV